MVDLKAAPKVGSTAARRADSRADVLAVSKAALWDNCLVALTAERLAAH